MCKAVVRFGFLLPVYKEAIDMCLKKITEDKCSLR